MAIEINGHSSPQYINANEDIKRNVSRNTATTTQEQTGKPTYTDTVTMTDTASLLSRLEQHISTLPVIDTQRVEQIKNEILNGEFATDYSEVADRLIVLESYFT